MKTLKLFEEDDKPQLRAYMSSSLTSFPNLSQEEADAKRDALQKLNLKIKKLCEDLNIDLYLPQESSNPASNHDDGLTPDEIYLLDRWRVAEADFVILNASELSFGVGQEMEIANSMGIPTIIFAEEEKTVSRMIKGAPCIFIPPGYDHEEETGEHEEKVKEKNETIITYPQGDIDELLKKLKNRIHILKEIVNPTTKTNSPKESFGKKLKDLREGKKLSHKELSEKTRFSIKFLQLLEKELTDLDSLGKEKDLNNQTFIDIDQNKFSNPGIWVLETLANGLEVTIADLVPSIPNVHTQDGVQPYQEACSELNLGLKQFFELCPKLGFEIHSYAAQNRFKSKDEFKKLISREIKTKDE